MLNLAGCGLKELPQSIFEPLFKLKVLGLTKNNLIYLGPEYFNNNPDLKLVNLIGNDISKFEVEGVTLKFE